VGDGTPPEVAWHDRGVRFQFGGFELDDTRFTLSGPDGPVHVEPQVFGLLHHLLRHADRVVPKEELLDAVWGGRFVSESALTSRVKAARRAVGDDGQDQRVIGTVHARGYRLVAEVRTDAGPALARRAPPRLRDRPLGRDRDIDSVIERLRAAPVVTITGPGGIGKTTIALAVADRVQADYADGVVFVDLAPVPPQAEVRRAVAEAAGITGTAAETVERVADHLADRPVLLVLDNCEHVLGRTVALVDRLLRNGGTADILITSRELLGVAGERVWPIGPLTDTAPVLFVQRARATEPRAPWDPADPAVVRLCRRLDGVPLALELAAGQLRRFDLDELGRRLDDRLALLSGRTSGAASRHASMETAIDWSYRLLEPTEQRLLHQLSVFPASFDVPAVEASAPELPGAEPIVVFGQLVDKSLVVRQPGTGRYRLLQPIRVFARDRLDEAGESEAAFERHRRHLLRRITSASRLDRWMSARLAAAFRADLEDSVQAFWFSLQRGEAHDAVDIAIGASFLWRNALACAEAEAIDSLLGLELSPRDTMWVHILRADVGQGRGDQSRLSGAAESARDLIGRTDDPAGACLAAFYAAVGHLTDPHQARHRLGPARDLARQSGDPRLTVMIGVFHAVADLAAGRHDEVRTAVTGLAATASADGYDRYLLHWAGWMLGLAEQDARGARYWMSRQQDYLDRTGIVETWITSFSTAMCDAVDGGDVRTALARTLALADREGYRADPDCLLVLAYAELCAGRFEAAAELMGAAVQGRFNATAHDVLYRTVLAGPLRRRLDPGRIAAAMQRGRARTPAEGLAAFGIGRDEVVRPGRPDAAPPPVATTR
jgi:predicted ATPase/DNA-binding winged helix-turn-helix (wHTH) protein